MRTNFAYESINDVITAGLDVLKSMPEELPESQFDIWFKYSEKVLDRLSSSRLIDYSIHINYLRLVTQFIKTNASPSHKLSACLSYLIEILRYIER